MSINSSYRKHILYTVLVLTSFLYDLMLGVLQFPFFSIAVFDILILYLRVSPFIYTSR